KRYFQAGKVIYDEKKQLEIIQKIADEYFEYFCNYAYGTDISVLGMLTLIRYTYYLINCFILGNFLRKSALKPSPNTESFMNLESL
ncbi:hypothetical protein, partial [Hominenteromicrobium sp.]|uniref:hypothetical protein n=1 Tax=Hominenteromicrobium sp. TaxID=3073581 RepID=UPI003AEF52E6